MLALIAPIAADVAARPLQAEGDARWRPRGVEEPLIRTVSARTVSARSVAVWTGVFWTGVFWTGVFWIVAAMLWWAEPASAQGAGLGAQAWRETPVRWLMTPGEARQVSRLRDDLELAQFMDAFWKRRDPDPSQAGNEFQLEFRQRVELADLLYGSDAARGSLSPRGGAFILLGPPSHLSQGFQTIPRLGVSRRATGPQGRGTLQVETWSWRPEDLSPRLRALLEGKGWSIPLSMTFYLRPSQVSLAEGDDLMELAARSYLHQE